MLGHERWTATTPGMGSRIGDGNRVGELGVVNNGVEITIKHGAEEEIMLAGDQSARVQPAASIHENHAVGVFAGLTVAAFGGGIGTSNVDSAIGQLGKGGKVFGLDQQEGRFPGQFHE